MFIWSFIAHDLLPLGEIGMRQLQMEPAAEVGGGRAAFHNGAVGNPRNGRMVRRRSVRALSGSESSEDGWTLRDGIHLPIRAFQWSE